MAFEKYLVLIYASTIVLTDKCYLTPKKLECRLWFIFAVCRYFGALLLNLSYHQRGGNGTTKQLVYQKKPGWFIKLTGKATKYLLYISRERKKIVLLDACLFNRWNLFQQKWNWSSWSENQFNYWLKLLDIWKMIVFVITFSYFFFSRFICISLHCPKTKFPTSIRRVKSTESSNYCTNYHHMIMKSGNYSLLLFDLLLLQ